MRDVVITGIGLAAPGGLCLADMRSLFSEGRSAIRRLDGVPGEWYGGVVDDRSLSAPYSRAELANLDRNALMALHAGKQAMSDSGLDAASFCEAGVYVGCGGGGTHAMEENYRSLIGTNEIRSTALLKSMANAAAAQLSIRFGMRGPNLTYSVACSSSAIAIGEAWRSIRHGELDVALAGGTETPLTEGVVRSWAAMRILARAEGADEQPRCRPFSARRNGLLLGEGAAFFVLEEASSARARGAVIHARLSGYAATADASHITAPSRAGQARAMRSALARAGLSADLVGYINAHGTGTRNGDLSEAQALHEVFGDQVRRTPVSATKSAHGHLIGAAGALELIPTVLAVRDGLIAPTIHFDEADPDCPLDCVPNQAREDRQVRHALSNSFAFGGSNATLVVSRFE